MTRKSLKRNLIKSENNQILKSAKYPSSHNNDQLIWTNADIFEIIFDYLNPKDKIQLSSVSKYLRSRLEPTIFRKIKLFPDDYLANPTQYGRNLNIRGIQSKLCEIAIKTLCTKSHMVKEIVLNEAINTKFGKTFFKTFSHITNLKVDNASIKVSTLIHVLQFLKELEYFHLDSYTLWFDVSHNNAILNYSLPHSIKSVKINHSMYIDSEFNPFLKITDNHINLQSFTLMGNGMFDDFKKPHPNLIELAIINYRSTDIDDIKQILTNNPQIAKLDMNGECLTESLFNLILSLNLTSLKFNLPEPEQVYNLSNLATNSSINKIEIGSMYPHEYVKIILNSCKSLQSLNLSSDNLNVDSINLKVYPGPLKSIEIHDSYCDYINFEGLINCKSLDQIILTKICLYNRETLMEMLNQLTCWKVIKDDPIILNRLT